MKPSRLLFELSLSFQGLENPTEALLCAEKQSWLAASELNTSSSSNPAVRLRFHPRSSLAPFHFHNNRQAPPSSPHIAGEQRTNSLQSKLQNHFTTTPIFPFPDHSTPPSLPFPSPPPSNSFHITLPSPTPSLSPSHIRITNSPAPLSSTTTRPRILA